MAPKLFETTVAALRAELRTAERGRGGIEALLVGSAEELNERWGSSAVLLKNGEFQVVAAAAGKPVEVTAGGTVTVRLLEGGTTSGVPKKRGEKWFKGSRPSCAS